MNELNEAALSKLSMAKAYPSLSLYMPTHRNYPENTQDIIRYKNLIKQLELLLLPSHSEDQVNQLLEPFEMLLKNENFWNHILDGLAVFANNGILEVFKLAETVKELAVVRAGFHLKPLRQYLQGSQRYYVLGLSLHEIQLFEGNRNKLSEIELPEKMAKTIEEALGSELTEKHSTVASYGGAGGQSATMHHGQGGKKEEVGKDAERFFRIVANEIESFLSAITPSPLIIAALPEHHHLFKKVNKNTSLLETAIDFNPRSVTKEKLADLAWDIIEESNMGNYQAVAENYRQAKADNLGTDDIEELMNAVSQGRVSTLLLKDDLIIPEGFFSAFSAESEFANRTYEENEEILNSIDETVISMGGQVIFLPEAYMPGETGYAAIYRY